MWGCLRKKLQVIFKKWDDGEPIAILEVYVEMRNHILGQIHHFYEEAEAKVVKTIEIKRISSSSIVFIVHFKIIKEKELAGSEPEYKRTILPLYRVIDMFLEQLEHLI